MAWRVVLALTAAVTVASAAPAQRVAVVPTGRNKSSPAAAIATRATTVVCARHSDCELGEYCDAGLACHSCSYISPDSCDAFDDRCCTTPFLLQCPQNPHLCQVRGGATGASVGVDQSMLNYAVEVFVPMLEEQLVSGEMAIPDMDDIDVGFLGTTLDLRDFVVNHAQFRNTTAQFSELPDGRVSLRTSVGLNVSVGYVQARRWPITCTGEMAVQTGVAGSTVAAELAVSYNKFSGDPAVTVTSTNCSLDFSFTADMSWCSWILDVLEFFLGSSFFQEQLCSSLDSALTRFVGDNMNTMLEEVNVSHIAVPLSAPYNTLAADLTVTRTPELAEASSSSVDGVRSASGRFLTTGVHAVALNTALQPPLGDPPGGAPQLPATPPRGDRMISLELSAWSVGSFPWVLHRSGLLNMTVDSSMVPDSSPVQLVTSDAIWRLVAPRLETLFPHRNMTVVARSMGPADSDEGAPRVAISDGAVSLAAGVDFAFELAHAESGEEAELFVITCPMTTTMTLQVEEAVTPTDTTACPAPFRSNFSSGSAPSDACAEHCGCAADAGGSTWRCDFCCLPPPTAEPNHRRQQQQQQQQQQQCQRLQAPSTQVGATLSLVDCALSERSSNVGPITMGPLVSGMINGIVLPVLMPTINEWAGDLWTLPQMAGFSLVRPVLTMQDSVAEIAGDIAYMPGGTPSGPDAAAPAAR
jgi:hypothetical protein